MADTQTATTQTEPAQPQVSAPAQGVGEASLGAQEAASLLTMIQDNPSLSKDPEIAEFLKVADTQATGAPAPKKEQAPEPAQPKASEAKQEQTPEQTPAPEPKQEEKNIFGESKDTSATSVLFGNQVPGSAKVNFQNFDDAIKYINGNYGMDLKDKDEMGKFFSSVNNWRDDAQRTRSAEQRIEDINQTFREMPGDLYDSFQAWANGQDYKETFAKSALDFSFDDDVNRIDEFKLVKHYIGGDFTREDLEDEENTMARKAVEMAKKQFSTDKKEFDRKREQLQSDARKREQSLRSSVELSVNSLQEKLPNLDASTLKGVRAIMEGGDLRSLFFDENGSFTQDAALNIVMAKHGFDEIKRIANIAYSQGQSNAAQEVVGNAPTEPNKPSSASPSAEEAQKAAAEQYSQLFNQRYY